MPATMTDPGLSRRSMIALLIVLVGLRIVFAPLLELIPDEAYYWTYSRHLDIGYLDHPPMIAWLIRIGTELFGQTELGVRLPALACGLLTIGFLAKLAFELHDREAGLAAAVLAAGLPFFIAFGAIATPDPPLIAGWAAALLYLKRALVDGRAHAWWGVGIAFGLGLLAKYTIILLGLSAFVFMLVDPEARRWFARPQPYLAALLALLLFSPVLVWNAEHQWASFLFQSSRRFDIADAQFSLHRFVWHTAVLVTPTAIAALAVAFAERRGSPEDGGRRARRLLWLCFAVPLGAFAAFGTISRPEPHWAGVAWIAAVPLIAPTLRAGIDTDAIRRGLARAWTITLMLLAGLYALLLSYVALGLPGNPVALINRHYFWEPTAVAVEEVEREVEALTGKPPLVVGTSIWSIAASLQFYRSRDPEDVTSRNALGRNAVMFSTWFRPEQAAGRPVVLVAFRAKDLQVDDRLIDPGPIQERPVFFRGRQVRTVFIRVAGGLRTSSAKTSP